MEKDRKTFIQTLQGTFPKETYSGKLVLPYEHLSQNLCDYYYNPNEVDSKQVINSEITLSNLSDNILNVYSNLKNLTLENEENKIANEISMTKEYSCGLILDVTSKQNGSNSKFLQKVGKLTDVHIAFGYTFDKDPWLSPDFNIENKDLYEEMRYEFIFGKEGIFPAFLGEIFISKEGPNQKEIVMLNHCLRLLKEHSVPIFLKVNKDNLNKTYFDKIEELAKGHKIENKKKIVFSVSNIENESSLKYIQRILQNGFSLIITTYDNDLVYLKEIQKNKDKINFELDNYFSQNKFSIISQILNEKKYLNQIMFSNNVNFLTQLKRYGGFGFNNFFQNYLEKLKKVGILNDSEIIKVFNTNIIELLDWWAEPIVEIKNTKTFTCQICKTVKLETDENYKKFDFIYCSTKCLLVHKSQNFKI